MKLNAEEALKIIDEGHTLCLDPLVYLWKKDGEYVCRYLQYISEYKEGIVDRETALDIANDILRRSEGEVDYDVE